MLVDHLEKVGLGSVYKLFEVKGGSSEPQHVGLLQTNSGGYEFV